MLDRNRFGLSIFVLLAFLSLVSCTTISNATEPPLILPNTTVLQITLTPTEIMTEESNVIEATPTMLPTLDPESAYAELEKMFRNNRCEFPCWWGIEPGTTSISDAETKLNGYYRIAPSKVIKDGLRLLLDVSILQQANIPQVNAIRIHEEVLRKITNGSEWAYDERAYTDLLGAYSLQSVLKTFGSPSNIFSTVQINIGESTSPDFMIIWLLYPEKGFVAKYTANAQLNNNIVSGCPSQSFFDLWLFPPDRSENYKQLRQLDPDLAYIFPALPPQTKPISEAFGISIDKFYEIFTESNNKCLETPYSIWPGW